MLLLINTTPSWHGATHFTWWSCIHIITISQLYRVVWQNKIADEFWISTLKYWSPEVSMRTHVSQATCVLNHFLLTKTVLQAVGTSSRLSLFSCRHNSQGSKLTHNICQLQPSGWQGMQQNNEHNASCFRYQRSTWICPFCWRIIIWSKLYCQHLQCHFMKPDCRQHFFVDHTRNTQYWNPLMHFNLSVYIKACVHVVWLTCHKHFKVFIDNHLYCWPRSIYSHNVFCKTARNVDCTSKLILTTCISLRRRSLCRVPGSSSDEMLSLFFLRSLLLIMGTMSTALMSRLPGPYKHAMHPDIIIDRSNPQWWRPTQTTALILGHPSCWLPLTEGVLGEHLWLLDLLLYVQVEELSHLMMY